jgi:hypothetical protein
MCERLGKVDSAGSSEAIDMITIFRSIAFALIEGFGPKGYAFASGIATLPARRGPPCAHIEAA